MKNPARLWWLFFIVPAASALFLLTGCSDDKPIDTPAPASGVKSRRERIEPRDESTGELARRHIYDDFDRELETHVSYRNGESASYFYREDGSTREYILRTANGEIKRRKVYDLDGKTVVEGKESRADGTTKWTMEKQKDGSTKTVTYWYDGNRVFSEEVKRADGSFEITFFRKNGKVWVKRNGKGDTVQSEEHFDKNGEQTLRVEPGPDNTSVVTLYTGGKPQARQTWKVEKNSWGSSYQTLQSVEEYGADGKVARKIMMDDSGWNPRSTEIYNSDGSRIVRHLRWDGTVEKEETFDAGGQSTSIREFKDDERVTETVDRRLLRRTYPEDPRSNWELQENYPYYRDRDE